MRIADRSATRTYLTQLNGAKTDFMKTQEQIFTGKRFTKMSDDVANGIRTLNSRFELDKTQTHYDNVAAVNDELSIAEDVLLDIEEILTRAKELALTALNGTNNSSNEVIAQEIAGLKDQLILLANTQVGSSFTFGGSNASSTEPFTVDDSGNLLYNGVNVSDIQVSDGTVEGIDEGSYYYLDDNGDAKSIPMDEDIYFDVGLGIKLNESQVTNNSAVKISFSGLDVFGFGIDEETGLSNNLYNILTDLENAVLENDTETMGEIELHFADLSDKFLVQVTSIGTTTNYLNAIESRLERNVDMYKIMIDNYMGTNDEEAITTLAMNEFILEMVQQLGSRIIPNSLMNFL